MPGCYDWMRAGVNATRMHRAQFNAFVKGSDKQWGNRDTRAYRSAIALSHKARRAARLSLSI